MKGVFSSADALLDYEAMKALFPDTPYSFESGGHPDAIPELTQEAFEHFHTTYYSPENSFIYLYGDMDIETTLQYLNDEYLSGFKRTGAVNSEIPLQNAFADEPTIGLHPLDVQTLLAQITPLTGNPFHGFTIAFHNNVGVPAVHLNSFCITSGNAISGKPDKVSLFIQASIFDILQEQCINPTGTSKDCCNRLPKK